MVVVTERGRWREKKEETSMSVPVVSRMPYTRVDVPAYLAWSNASSQAQPADQPTDPPQIGSCIYHSLSSAAAAQAKYVSSPSAPPSSSSFAAAPAPPRPMSETAHLSKWSPRPLRLAQVYCYRADMTLYCCSVAAGAWIGKLDTASSGVLRRWRRWRGMRSLMAWRGGLRE